MWSHMKSGQLCSWSPFSTEVRILADPGFPYMHTCKGLILLVFQVLAPIKRFILCVLTVDWVSRARRVGVGLQSWCEFTVLTLLLLLLALNLDSATPAPSDAFGKIFSGHQFKTFRHNLTLNFQAKSKFEI